MEDGWGESIRRVLPGGAGRVDRAALLLRKSRQPRSCGGFDRHAVALALEELDRATGDALAVRLIAVIGSQLSIDRVIREDVVRRA